MWANLANNGDFHLGMGSVGDKITHFFIKWKRMVANLLRR
jgi:hypothetical protein